VLEELQHDTQHDTRHTTRPNDDQTGAAS